MVSRPIRVLVEGADGVGKDVIREKAIQQLSKLGVRVKVCFTTKAGESESSKKSREILVSPYSSALERFTAASLLYRGAEFSLDTKDADVVIYDRGWSGFIVYNEIPWADFEDQSLLIPDIDYPVLVTAPFDQLTSRIEKRNGSNFVSHQDSDLKYRHDVWKKYRECFEALSKKRHKEYLIIENEDGMLDVSVYKLVTFIVTKLIGGANESIPC